MENNEAKNKSVAKDIGGIIAAVVFFASFAPYFILIYFGIDGINFGMQGIVRAYGIAGVIIGAIILFVVGILPICIVLQAVLGKVYISKHAALSRITKILYIAIIVMLVLTEPISRIINKIKMDTEPDRIVSYLEDKYGEEMAADANIVYDHGEVSDTVRYYHVYTSVLPDNAYFEVVFDPAYNKENRMRDNLMTRFNEANPDYNAECQEYLLDKHNAPAEITKVVSYVYSIEFRNYRAGDDYTVLFDRTTLVISNISVYTDDTSEDGIRQTIDKVLSNEFLKDQAQTPSYDGFILNVKEEGAAEEDDAIARVYVNAGSNNKYNARVYLGNNHSGTPDWTFELS